MEPSLSPNNDDSVLSDSRTYDSVSSGSGTGSRSYDSVSSDGRNAAILNRLGQALFQSRLQQLRIRNPQQNPRPLQLNAYQSIHQQRQNQSIHQQQHSWRNILTVRAIQPLPFRRPPVHHWYDPNLYIRRLTYYMHQQQHRPQDNNIEYWRQFVARHFATNAKMKLCVSSYGYHQHNIPEDQWHCELCAHGNGFEASVEVFPRLFKVKYESVLEELLFIKRPRIYRNRNGQIVVHCQEALEESIFEQFRVVRNGQLRIVFNLDLKISSWHFCTLSHTESIHTNLLIPQVYQHGASSNMLVGSAGESAQSMEVSQVIEFGYPRPYIRSLQIAEVIIDMMDFTQEVLDEARQQQIDQNQQAMDQARQQQINQGQQAMDQARQQQIDQNRQAMDQARQQQINQTQQALEQARQQQIDPIANHENGPPEDENSDNSSEVTVESAACMELGDDFVESAMRLNVE